MHILLRGLGLQPDPEIFTQPRFCAQWHDNSKNDKQTKKIVSNIITEEELKKWHKQEKEDMTNRSPISIIHFPLWTWWYISHHVTLNVIIKNQLLKFDLNRWSIIIVNLNETT